MNKVFLSGFKLLVCIAFLLLYVVGCVPQAAVVWEVRSLVPSEMDALEAKLHLLGYQNSYVSPAAKVFDSGQHKNIHLYVSFKKEDGINITYAESMTRRFTAVGIGQLEKLNLELIAVFGSRLHVLVDSAENLVN